jgi:8-oxo-dGTP pyrophosphatase MutT (NUDIX family)
VQLLDPGHPALRPSSDLADARAHVAAVTSLDPAVQAAREQILRFVDGHPDALRRSCTEAHLTGSALVVDPAGPRVLLLHHAKLRRWLQPGGHADGQANLAAAALAEATEETGLPGLAVAVPALDLDVHRVAPPGEAPHLHLDVRFVVLARPGSEPRGNHESTDLRWVDPQGLADYDIDEGLRRLVRVGLAAVPGLEPPGRAGT